MEEQKREFTGIWIPRKVVEDERLTWTERAVYGEISCYERCFMSNAFFARRIGISERQVREVLSTLKDLGYIEQTGFDGRHRFLAVKGGDGVQGREEVDLHPERKPISMIDNNIENNIELSETKVSRDEIDTLEDDVSFEDDEEIVPTKTLRKKGTPKSLEPEIQKMWALWPGDHGQWRINKTIRSASEILLHEKGMEKVANAVKFWLDNKNKPFCPDISTPYKLGERWDSLVAYRRKQKYGR